VSLYTGFIFGVFQHVRKSNSRIASWSPLFLCARNNDFVCYQRLSQAPQLATRRTFPTIVLILCHCN
jgi:hypothetical protein